MRDGLTNVRALKGTLVEQTTDLRGDAPQRALADSSAREGRCDMFLEGRRVQTERKRHLAARDEDPGPGVRAGHVDQRRTIDGRAIDRLARGVRHARADR